MLDEKQLEEITSDEEDISLKEAMEELFLVIEHEL